MAEIYSTYEAKARFSEIIRRVRAGRRIVISHRGEPVAEIAPIAIAPKELAEIVSSLEREGVLAKASRSPAEAARTWPPVAKRPGALARFLASRAE